MAYLVSVAICGTGSWEALGLPHPFITERMNQYKILSLSANPKNPVMWAHYTNNYAEQLNLVFCVKVKIGTMKKQIRFYWSLKQLLDRQIQILWRRGHLWI